ncbi:hypothetical protein NEPAR06_1795 [Nematocida parisii]|uniref:Uncharacterized protein n=1 Tax=Nematocida parisii (strain ERTm3) TaxID=935791 RepID=I3EKB6_NEMP3|nr:uncharacterized protein NEPG_00802 [Nematocida parisii ERTm1]EIJ89663.1 hypothetical protein NEQG_00433 [Nematocida parisii ERTm3]KAI5126835.1 hypothetical protein NEPAR03_0666 [Nematocida parisii]EIJ94135.1 hypothetical protein NEPG_00802 [Nematocida parisii ERTm1]KAI5126915.1 hypothetical protein NEPAR08_0665 [Nematocida parisii]KAI5141025.1 hypothetical protein NEPAR04_0663 [Nematocida parisii]|eukprot:XP_013058631.1 hypothetical protein NEPG_00802 [Nematocida parisii ERTm1]
MKKLFRKATGQATIYDHLDDIKNSICKIGERVCNNIEIAGNDFCSEIQKAYESNPSASTTTRRRTTPKKKLGAKNTAGCPGVVSSQETTQSNELTYWNRHKMLFLTVSGVLSILFIIIYIIKQKKRKSISV